MKRINKFLAVILSIVCLFSVLVPAVAFAEDAEPAEETTTKAVYNPEDQYDFENPLPAHPTIDDVWDYVTDGTGDTANIDWKKLPKAFLDIFKYIRIFEVISNFIRNLFGK